MISIVKYVGNVLVRTAVAPHVMQCCDVVHHYHLVPHWCLLTPATLSWLTRPLSEPSNKYNQEFSSTFFYTWFWLKVDDLSILQANTFVTLQKLDNCEGMSPWLSRTWWWVVMWDPPDQPRHDTAQFLCKLPCYEMRRVHVFRFCSRKIPTENWCDHVSSPADLNKTRSSTKF